MEEVIRALIKDAVQGEHERRAAKRHPFVYPVSIHTPNQPPDFGFSRDLSQTGLGLIHSSAWAAGTIADLEIHGPSEKPVAFKSEVRWAREYGNGWYLIGWRFLSLVTLQIVAQTPE